MVHIFIIGGMAGSGKTTLGEALKKEVELIGRKPCLMQFAAPLYSYAKNYFSWDGDIKHKPREFLQKFGIEMIKNKLNKPYFLVNRLCEDIEILSEFFDTFIITDARLIDEFLEMKKRYQHVTTIKVIRKNVNNGLTKKEQRHITETELMGYDDFDYIIDNFKIEEIENEVKNIILRGGLINE